MSAVMTEQARCDWDKAYQDYLVAHSLYLEAVREFERFPIGDESPESNLASNGLFFATDSLIVVQAVLMGTPAPDLAAVAIKLEELYGYVEEVTDGKVVRFSQEALEAAKLGNCKKALKCAKRAESNDETGDCDAAGLEFVIDDLRRLSA